MSLRSHQKRPSDGGGGWTTTTTSASGTVGRVRFCSSMRMCACMGAPLPKGALGRLATELCAPTPGVEEKEWLTKCRDGSGPFKIAMIALIGARKSWRKDFKRRTRGPGRPEGA